MSVEVGAGVIFRWNDVTERMLENLAPGTPARKKVQEVRDDVYKLAVAYAPVGGPRITDPQPKKIKTSHGRAAGFRKVGPKHYQTSVYNSAPHAVWVHEGTQGSTGKIISAGSDGKWMGPVHVGPGQRQLQHINLRRQGKVVTRAGTKYVIGQGFVLFDWYTFQGQKANNWLERAGTAAFRMNLR